MDFEDSCSSVAADQKRNLLKQQQIAQMNVQKYGKQQRTHLTFKGLNFALQLSEWMVWPPSDLQRWMLVPCPRGMRCLVVAQHAHTEIFSKNGRRICSFRSQLPGDSTAAHTLTVLDCIYDCKVDVLYVLDTLFYGVQNLMACSADFRYFWLKSQFHDNVGFSKRSTDNNKPFILVQHYDCDNDEILSKAFMIFPQFVEKHTELDGFLFYHKDAQYTCGLTPLVGWLFAFMVPDVLGYNVNSHYVTPLEYRTPLQYIANFDAKLAIKNYKQVQRLHGNYDHESASMEQEDPTAMRKRKMKSLYGNEREQPDIFNIAPENEQEEY